MSPSLLQVFLSLTTPIAHRNYALLWDLHATCDLYLTEERGNENLIVWDSLPETIARFFATIVNDLPRLRSLASHLEAANWPCPLMKHIDTFQKLMPKGPKPIPPEQDLEVFYPDKTSMNLNYYKFAALGGWIEFSVARWRFDIRATRNEYLKVIE